MRMWTIVKYTLLSNVRDVRTIISHLLSPIILMVILGSALSAAFNATSLGTIKVGMVIKEETDFSKNLCEYLEKETDFLTLEKYKTVEEIKKAIEEEAISVAIEVPEDLETKVAEGEKAAVSLWTSNKDSYQTTVVKTLLGVCMDATNTILAEVEYGVQMPSYELKVTEQEQWIIMQ